MSLWFHWWSIVSQLRSACPRQRTFFWLGIVLAALCTRQDLAGVISFVRALGLRARCYGCLLDFFHSPALCPDNLARLWSRLVLKVHPGVVRAHGRLVVLADGLKKSKCGRQMPAVKLLHQSGESNTKPAFIMGHSCQALAVLARVGQWHQAVPLCARIHEGLVFSNRDQRHLARQTFIAARVAAPARAGAARRRCLLRQRQNHPRALHSGRPPCFSLPAQRVRF